MQKIYFFLLMAVFDVTLSFAQTAPATPDQQAGDKVTRGFNFFTDVLGKRGVLIAVGIIFFAYTYKNSVKLFAWIEDQTYGTRDYLMKKFDLMHIEVEPQKVTYALLFFSIGLSLLVVGVMTLLGHFVFGLFIGAVLSFVGWKAPRPIVDHMEKRRVVLYQNQMVDALNLLANGLRAGLSVPQSIGMVVDELPPPVSQEFNLILQESKIGVPLEEAFDNLNKRVKTEDNEMFVTSVNILRETGGNLAETFDTIVSVIRERVRLQQKIATYVAQGMFQGMVIFAMPYAQLLIGMSNEPKLAGFMFTHPVGIIMLIGIMVLSGVGLFVIMKIVDIKV